jgi:hypothetical protein
MASDLRLWSGADRTRTDDFLLAKQVLYQLSYRPNKYALPAKDATAGRSPSQALRSNST